jgi:hypothetical protein
MTARPIEPRLPPQLRDLSATAPYLPEALRDALQATLSVAPDDSTPEQVLSDTFARLGYLPDEATQATRKLLAQTSRAN